MEKWTFLMPLVDKIKETHQLLLKKKVYKLLKFYTHKLLITNNTFELIKTAVNAV